MPASLPDCSSSISALNPRFSAQRRYILSSIWAKSCASVPPAPAWIEQMALLRSVSPESRLSICAASTSFSSRAISVCSSFAESASSAANSNKTSASETPGLKSLLLLQRASMRLRCWTTFWAFSWSSQKPGSEINFSDLSSSACFAGASKKPPKLGNFFFDRFEFCL